MVTRLDLWGQPIPMLISFAARRRAMGYRVADGVDRICKTCSHLRKKNHHGSNHYKCDLIGDSASAATDVRLKYVCDHWTKEAKL